MTALSDAFAYDANPNLTLTPEKEKTMTAFNNDPALRDMYLRRALQHEKARNFVQEHGYFIYGKGNPSGCLTENNVKAPSLLEKIGIPQSLTYLSDQIFEYLPQGKHAIWTHDYVQAIRTGANLQPVVSYFIVKLLHQEILERFSSAKYPDLHRLCINIVKYHWQLAKGITPTHDQRKLIRIASSLTQSLSYAAAYAATKDTLTAAHMSYVANYSMRVTGWPPSASRIVIGAKNSGVNPVRLGEMLLMILRNLDKIASLSQMSNFLELLG